MMDFESMAEIATSITELSPQELRILAHDLASIDPHMALTFATTILSALENKRQVVQVVAQPASGRDYVYVDEDESLD
jgi:16S rRNA C967 or C1407 C5-methylase (RsmB/RsmF family)